MTLEELVALRADLQVAIADLPTGLEYLGEKQRLQKELAVIDRSIKQAPVGDQLGASFREGGSRLVNRFKRFGQSVANSYEPETNPTTNKFGQQFDPTNDAIAPEEIRQGASRLATGVKDFYEGPATDVLGAPVVFARDTARGLTGNTPAINPVAERPPLPRSEIAGLDGPTPELPVGPPEPFSTATSDSALAENIVYAPGLPPTSDQALAENATVGFRQRQRQEDILRATLDQRAALVDEGTAERLRLLDEERAIKRQEALRQEGIQRRNAELDQESAQFTIDQQQRQREENLAVAEQRYQDSAEAFARNKAATAARLAISATPETLTNDNALSTLASITSDNADVSRGGVVNNILKFNQGNASLNRVSNQEAARLGFEGALNFGEQQDTDTADLRLQQLRDEVNNPAINPATQYRADNLQFDPTASQRLRAISDQEWKLNEGIRAEAANKLEAETIANFLSEKYDFEFSPEDVARNYNETVNAAIEQQRKRLEELQGKQEIKETAQTIKSVVAGSSTARLVDLAGTSVAGTLANQIGPLLNNRLKGVYSGK